MSGLLSWSEEHCESICCLRTWLLPKLKCKDFSAAHIIFFLTLYNKVCVDICVHIFILMLAGNSFFVCNSFIPFFFAMFTFKPKVCPKNTDMLPRLWRKVITWAWFFFFFCLYCFHFLHLRVLHFFMLCSNRNTLDSVNVQIAFPSLLLSPPILDKKWFPLWLLRAPLCSLCSMLGTSGSRGPLSPLLKVTHASFTCSTLVPHYAHFKETRSVTNAGLRI